MFYFSHKSKPTVNVIMKLHLPDVHAKTSVLAGTFQTDPDTIRDTDPLWIVGAALKTQLQS